ncbi:glycosyltransferase [Polynucleobacter sp. MWH-UH35A]|uniref:glycosyltransferase n=1 Tax=Polynucleobacter sp. MWH-UH35A TaxID=1855619 RepID=UPI001BFE3B65|nr:glycosyltransferase [Polynucleobacter sp. MWH-UH35A]QWD60435.1 glycosyltransferase [Polynucleobacter sp. MWH-UH35A]
MNNHKITASIVLYNTAGVLINRLLACIHNSGCIDAIFIVDNSPEPNQQLVFEDLPVEYIRTQRNIGYGSGHNIALKKAIKLGSDFHFIFNPDISFGESELQKMISRICDDKEIGQLMPKVINPDGSLQYLCKLLPIPLDLVLRRFAIGPLKRIAKARADKFELRFTGYKKEMNVPFLSGCFMLFRVSALQKIGLFDESFFMYGEDIDLTRRMHSKYKTIFFPGAVVIHDHARESYKNIKMLWIHSVNVGKYFNKWGWFLDPDRKKMNAAVINSLGK